MFQKNCAVKQSVRQRDSACGIKRAMAEKMITIAKANDLHSKRQVYSYITKETVAKKVMDEIAPKYADRNGGYTRITKLGPRRGDAAEYDDYADEFYRRAGVFGEEVERVRRGTEDFHGGAISSAGRRRGRSIPARGPPTPILSAWRGGSAPSRIRRRRATLWSSA